MNGPDREADTAHLVRQLYEIYGLSEADARFIVSDREFAAMAKSFVEGKLASDEAFRRWDEAVKRLRDALAESTSRR